jgi:hypothetical protein
MKPAIRDSLTRHMIKLTKRVIKLSLDVIKLTKRDFNHQTLVIKLTVLRDWPHQNTR